jgi:hypothetical protein
MLSECVNRYQVDGFTSCWKYESEIDVQTRVYGRLIRDAKRCSTATDLRHKSRSITNRLSAI